MSQQFLDFDSARTVADTAVRLLQCTNVLASVNSDDENQKLIARLSKTMKTTLLNKSPKESESATAPKS